MHEVLNTVVPVAFGGTARPDLDLSEPHGEELFARVVREQRPDVVHVHELLGLPSSLLDLSRREGAAVVVTLHDYGLLCPVLRLYDADGQLCRRKTPGEMCAVCCRHAAHDNSSQVWPTVAGEFLRLTERLPETTRRRALGGAQGLVGMLRRVREFGVVPGPTERPSHEDAVERPTSAPAAAYDRRREGNVERLGAVDRLLAPSSGAARVVAELGVPQTRLRTLPLTVPHLERLRARRVDDPLGRVRFATLNGACDPLKGSRVLVDALRILEERGLRGRFELRVHGFVDPGAHEELVRLGAQLAGPYDIADLDTLLDDVDVGIVPSTWEEVLGFVGLEFLAKGIPLIGNARGGITDYTRDGETGWVNRSCSGRELADLMEQIVHRPEQVLELHRRIVARRDELIKPFERHLDELDDVYAGVTGAQGA